MFVNKQAWYKEQTTYVDTSASLLSCTQTSTAVYASENLVMCVKRNLLKAK